jgi:LmbE family N-acetylglucosaminyl deacetylase
LALLGGSGTEVNVVFLTDGRASHPEHPLVSPEMMATLRKNEAMAATGALRVAGNHVFFLDAPDGTLALLGHEGIGDLVGKIAGILRNLSPDAVLLTCRRDGSTDHEASFRLVQLALKESGQTPRIFEYPIWAWRNPLLLVRPLLTSRKIWRSDIRTTRDLKSTALEAYASQVRPIPPDKLPLLSPDFVSEFMFTEEFLFEK